MSTAKKAWDLASANSFSGALDWVRKRGGATLILAIRPQDIAFSIHPELEPLEAVTMLRNELPGLLQHLIDVRAAKLAKKTNGGAKPERNFDAEDPQ